MKPHEPSSFPGVQFLVDFAKQVFVLSDRIEDQLMCVCKCDLASTCVINSAVVACENEMWDYKDTLMVRCWKRFVAHHLIPLVNNSIRWIVLDARQKRYRDAEMKEWGYCLAHPI